MKQIIFPALLLMLTLLTSCSKELITPVTPDNVPIVESYLYAGDSTITVKVTKILPFSLDTIEATEYISGLHLQINGADLTETASGVYALNLGEKRIIASATHIGSRMDNGPELTNQNITSFDYLSAKSLNATSLAGTMPTVSRATTCFLMSHLLPLFSNVNHVKYTVVSVIFSAMIVTQKYFRFSAQCTIVCDHFLIDTLCGAFS